MAPLLSDCSNCCAEEQPRGTAAANAAATAPAPTSPDRMTFPGSNRITESPDRTRARELDCSTARQWVAVTAYQPIDTITKTVEIPVIQTVEKFVPKLSVEEKIVQVPKYIPQVVEKLVEVPELRYVDKIIEVPQYHYQYKCVPKVETRENIIERPRIDVKYVEKVVEVPQIKEVVRYQDVETVEEVIKYVPKREFGTEVTIDVTAEQSTEISAEGESFSARRAVPAAPSTASYSTGATAFTRAPVTITVSPREHPRFMPPTAYQRAPYLAMPPPYTASVGTGVSYHPAGIPTFAPPPTSISMPPSSFPGAMGLPPGAMGLPPGAMGPPPGQMIPGTPFPAYPMDHMSRTPSSPGDTARSSTAPFSRRLEHVFKPKVVKTVELQKHVPISVDVPVPYMVPKPVVVPVQVPVLKFRDHFVPVPVRRRVVPRIRWTNEVYEVECIKEKPFMQVQDVIKPVPCDVEIRVHEFVDKAQPINPTELSQADVHAMWMRVNADLAEKRKEELGDRYPHVKHPPGTVFGEPGCQYKEEGGEGGGLYTRKDLEDEEKKSDEEAPQSVPAAREGDFMDPIALHPGHPLSMTYLQNQWIKKDTTSTHQMYTNEWFGAHQNALHTLTMQHPTQIQLPAEQAAALQPREQAFGQVPWLSSEALGSIGPPPSATRRFEPESSSDCCGSGTCSNCCSRTVVEGEEQKVDSAACCEICP